MFSVLAYLMLYISMKIAIPIKDNELSVVIDFSLILHIVVIKEKEIVIRKNIQFNKNDDLNMKINVIKNNEIDLVICGSISNAFYRLFEMNNIKIIPYICGNLDDVINAYIDDRLNCNKFLMSGCMKHRNRYGNNCKRNLN